MAAIIRMTGLLIDWTSRSWTPAVRRNGYSCGASGLVHVALFATVAGIGWSLPNTDELPALSSVWSEPELLPELWQPLVSVQSVVSPNPGGSPSESFAAWQDDQPLAAQNVDRPLDSRWSPLEMAGATWTTADLLSPAGESRRSTGTGNGRGDGTGDGDGFFGISPAVGQKIVYVVDKSRSMNHPHDSEAKTRFRRLKIELVNSI